MRTTTRCLVNVLGAGLVGAGLAACTPEYRPEAQGQGDSATHNFMMQAVNPMPNPAVDAPEQDGKRAADAYQRYRDGKVIKPTSVTTSTVSGGAN